MGKRARPQTNSSEKKKKEKVAVFKYFFFFWWFGQHVIKLAKILWVSILRYSPHSVCCCSRDSRAGVAHAGWDWHHIQHCGTLSKTSCASSVGLVTSCRKPVPGSIFTWGNSRQQTCKKISMLCVCATFCQAMALCSQVRDGKVSRTNFFSFLVLVQKQRCFRFFSFSTWTAEKRGPLWKWKQ